MEACSLDLRRRVVAAVEGKSGTWTQIAGRFGVSTAFIGKLIKQRRANGSITPKANAGGVGPKVDGRDATRLSALVERHNDLTPHELRDRLGLPVSHMAVHRALVRLGITRKKDDKGRRARTPGREGGPRDVVRPAVRGLRWRLHAGAVPQARARPSPT